MDNNISQQLLIEIKKLKERDYTSYQNFYNQTAQYLYGVIWETVQDQEVSNTLMNELYTDIYASIGEELTDDTQFYAWATSKAKTLSNTYVATNVLVDDKDDDKLKGAAAAVIAGAAMNGIPETGAGAAQADVVVNAGMGATSGGASTAGMGTVAGGNMNTGMGMATNGNMSTSMGQTAGGNMSTGAISNGNPGVQTGSITNGSANVGASVATKTGMSLVTKIAIAVAGVAVATGIGVAVYKFTKPDDNKNEAGTEITTEDVVIEDTTEATDTTDTTEEVTEEVTTEEVATEEQAEEVLDEATIARYSAYYEVVKPYMEQYQTELYYSTAGWTTTDGVRYVNLIDFNGDGNKQLVIVYKDGSNYANPTIADIYDYVDGAAVLLASVDCGHAIGEYGTQSLYVCEQDGKTIIWILEDGFNRTTAAESTYTRLSYSDSNQLEIHTYKDDKNSFFMADGSEVDQETYQVYQSQRDLEIENADYYPYYNSGISFGNYMAPDSLFAKAMIVKHRAIEKMASCAGDTAFLAESEVTINTVEDEHYGEVSATAINKYNEVYKICAKHDNVEMTKEVSADGKTIHIYENQDVESGYGGNIYHVDADLCFTYVEDVLVLVGHKYQYFELVGDEYEEYTIFAWYEIDNYVSDDMSDDKKYSVSEDVYNANVNSLITR